jgi:hypothetical protein
VELDKLELHGSNKQEILALFNAVSNEDSDWLVTKTYARTVRDISGTKIYVRCNFNAQNKVTEVSIGGENGWMMRFQLRLRPTGMTKDYIRASLWLCDGEETGLATYILYDPLLMSPGVFQEDMVTLRLFATKWMPQ